MLGLLIEKYILKNYDIKMYILYITAHKVAKKKFIQKTLNLTN